MNKVSLCACLGPMYGEPQCPCVMNRDCIPRSEEYKEYFSPENIKLRDEQLNKIFGKYK